MSVLAIVRYRKAAHGTVMKESQPPKSLAPINRIQENVLARSERRLLNWICARMPAWVTPDLLTGIGMVGAFMVFGGYLASNLHVDWLWLAIAGYAVQWFGDSTDGSLARFRQIERPRYGYFLDHSCDGLATTLVVVGIGLSPYVTLEWALVALAGYLLLSIHAFLSVRVLGELKLSYLNAGPTELRFMLIALTLAMMWFGTGPGWFGMFSGFDLFTGGVGLILIALFAIQTAVTSRRLATEEPARNDEYRRRQ
jgi:phosphatidylglycerophosphate synthase